MSVDIAEVEFALNLVQGSPEWLAYKCGKVGASRVGDITAKIKDGKASASREAYAGELIAERLTGINADNYKSAAMQWGNDVEPLARTHYAFEKMTTVETVGCVLHPKIVGSLASPDGLIGDHGLLEVKCPATHTHIATLLGAPVPDRYIKQAMWQLACTGRRWVDLVSYDPRMPENMKLHVTPIPRNDELIAVLEDEVKAFLADVDERLAALTDTYGQAVAA